LCRADLKLPRNLLLFLELELGQNSGPASWPDYNRYMEPVINKLCQICPSPVSEERWKHRNTTLWWTLVENAYKKIPTPHPQELACRLEFNTKQARVLTQNKNENSGNYR